MALKECEHRRVTLRSKHRRTDKLRKGARISNTSKVDYKRYAYAWIQVVVLQLPHMDKVLSDHQENLAAKFDQVMTMVVMGVLRKGTIKIN